MSAMQLNVPTNPKARGSGYDDRLRSPGCYLTAMGLTGAPTAPVIGSGAAVSQKSEAPSWASMSRSQHLAEEESYVGDSDLVQRLDRVVELVGSYLEAPGVGGDRGDLGAVQPIGRGEGQAGRGAAGAVVQPSRRARVSRPVRTRTMSPRPTDAEAPCRSIVSVGVPQ